MTKKRERTTQNLNTFMNNRATTPTNKAILRMMRQRLSAMEADAAKDVNRRTRDLCNYHVPELYLLIRQLEQR